VIAANPELQQMPDDDRGRLIGAMHTAMQSELQHFIVGDDIVSTKQTHILRARC
jgi:hypothetical protein